MSESVEERMVKLETDIHYIKESLTEHKETSMKQNQELHTKIDAFIEAADRKFASKVTEVVVYGLVGTILTVVILSLLRLIVI